MKRTWVDHEKLAEHYRALGTKQIYLSAYDGDTDRPWHLVTKCEPGGSHRLEIDTDVTFYATGLSGLTYRWSFDIEPRSANGSGSYDIATDEISRILGLLPEKAKISFKKYLTDCAKAVRKKADEWSDVAKAQHTTARKLEELCAS